MFSLTLREQFLLVGILCALVTGAAVKHWRDARRQAKTATVSPDAPAKVRATPSPFRP